jgi:saccharopine dehydrogenase-like NADP-dependent oxidoreductase
LANVLVLGAGMVTRPMIEYLMKHGIKVTIATRTVSKAEAMIAGNPLGEAIALNIDDAAHLAELVKKADLVVSMLPYIHHLKVARLCLDNNKPLVTTSYVSPAMRELDAEATSKGLLFLNEIGVDPGIDHMSAMRIIHGVKERGGKITSFHSYCGGLPAPEANTNPLGYKFSWSPTGVMLAGKNNGRILIDGKIVFIPSLDLFSQIHYKVFPKPIGTLEAYTNRDSIPYIELYGLEGIGTMTRNTFRNISWCPTLRSLTAMGYLNADYKEKLPGTLAELTAQLIKGKVETIRNDVATYLGRPEDDRVLDNMAWLDLFSSRKVPPATNTPFDVLAALFLEKMEYEAGERDLLILHHEFIADYPDGRQESITSTMIDYGIPHGDSSMARTVSLPAAIAVRLILEGRIKMTGVRIPVYPEIYNPVLDELAQMNIVCEECIR